MWTMANFTGGKNGTYFNSADPAAGTGGLDVSATLGLMVQLVRSSVYPFQEVVHTTKLIQLILVKILKMYQLQIQMKMVSGTFEYYTPPNGFLRHLFG